ncbi:hypothetical protein WR25_17628 [Diploscapter pachys]|uniref:Uncharacterized protein n=1 Tax=Diploscapter pachys TaxID=2018661 RepID=A0A2A2KXY8_9BILA|nr:hypothetical protein WR25_17628 [Diploscapter pachys]
MSLVTLSSLINYSIFRLLFRASLIKLSDLNSSDPSNSLKPIRINFLSIHELQMMMFTMSVDSGFSSPSSSTQELSFQFPVILSPTKALKIRRKLVYESDEAYEPLPKMGTCDAATQTDEEFFFDPVSYRIGNRLRYLADQFNEEFFRPEPEVSVMVALLCQSTHCDSRDLLSATSKKDGPNWKRKLESSCS